MAAEVCVVEDTPTSLLVAPLGTSSKRSDNRSACGRGPRYPATSLVILIDTSHQCALTEVI